MCYREFGYLRRVEGRERVGTRDRKRKNSPIEVSVGGGGERSIRGGYEIGSGIVGANNGRWIGGAAATKWCKEPGKVWRWE